MILIMPNSHYDWVGSPPNTWVIFLKEGFAFVFSSLQGIYANAKAIGNVFAGCEKWL